MKHLGTVRIETQRLILRRFVREDARTMYDNWASDPEVTKYLTWPTHENPSVSEWVVNDWISHYEEPEHYQWAIELKELGQPIGSISVVSRNDKARLVHIGYCIGKPWWGRGIMTEALGAMLAFFFEQVGVNRVELRHDPNNPGSGAVMRKCGLRFEGIMRQADWNNQGICDAAWYAMLRKDWERKLE